MATSYGISEHLAALPNRLSDEEAITRVRAGETGLYEILMRRYNQRLFRIARSIVHDYDEAEDIMQHAYVQAFSSLDRFAGNAQFATWLTKIAVYEAYRRTRKLRFLCPVTPGRRQENDMDAIVSFDPDPEKQALSPEAISILEQAIDALPRIYRSVFVLRELETLSTAEAAACLDITEENVKVRLLRARHMLRNELHARVDTSSSRAFQFMGYRCDRVVRHVLDAIAGQESSSPSHFA